MMHDICGGLRYNSQPVWHGIVYNGTMAKTVPDSKVHGSNRGPTWVLPAPDGPHFGPTKLAIRGDFVRLWNHGKFDVIKKQATFENHPNSNMAIEIMRVSWDLPLPNPIHIKLIIQPWQPHHTSLIERWQMNGHVTEHDDVMKWKRFPYYWPFVWGISRWIHRTKASDVEL